MHRGVGLPSEEYYRPVKYGQAAAQQASFNGKSFSWRDEMVVVIPSSVMEEGDLAHRAEPF